MSSRNSVKILLITMITALLCSPIATADIYGYGTDITVDTMPFYPGGTYDPAITHPDSVLTHPLGKLPSRYFDMVHYIMKVAQESPRVELRTHGESHEGRTLYHLVISSEANMARLDEIKGNLTALSDPRTADGDYSLPACAWMGYSIHGDELSGVDAAIRLIYQLAAGTDELTKRILDSVVVIVDPNQNPDGRERYLTMLETFSSTTPNYDPSAMQHNGVWPWGRSNHYWFDMNRDWILATQPETQGRLATQLEWHPQMVIDGHEMGPNATYLTDPPREPIHHNTAPNIMKWWERLSTGNADAFGKRGWPVYVEEWHDQWYPGYGSAWPTFSGTVGLLYEQARVDGEMIQQRDGYMLTYHEAVNHQFTSSIANLASLEMFKTEALQDYANARKTIVGKGKRTYLFVPDGDELKTNRFMGSLLHQGIEVKKASSAFTVRATNSYGKTISKNFPAGTYVVNTAQPMGYLANAVLEFDPRLKMDFLKKERRHQEKYGRTLMYEVSAWTPSLLYDMDAWYTDNAVNVIGDMVSLPLEKSPGNIYNVNSTFGFIVPYEGEKTYILMARLFGEGFTMFASEKPFMIGGKDFAPGSLVLRKRGNPEDMPDRLIALAKETGSSVHGVPWALTDKGSWLGAGSFELLRQPRVAVLVGDGINYTAAGSQWFAIDKEIGLPHSLVMASSFNYFDISAYNVILIPGAWGRGIYEMIGKSGARRLQSWMRGGGTLICGGQAAVWAADSTVGLTSAKLRRQAMDDWSKFDAKLKREIAAEAPAIDTMALYHPEKVAKPEKDEKKAEGKPGKPDKDTEDWARRFRPRGVILKAVIDTADWLAFGMKTTLPVMTYSSHAFLAADPVKTTARYEPDPNELRLSGLLWPEARERWAGTAYAMRENHGKGQIILFAGSPNFRAYTWGSRKMLMNALLYGPGMGSRGAPYAEEEM